ncbi:hypothetical protein NBE98_11100 [Clostridium swellfunianum]|nr:hypothetical protein [Clostridium swellfunianum]MCM0648921.1 hypothetical protein [Clostridium swellfunianum]
MQALGGVLVFSVPVILKAILEALLYISLIVVAFKVVQALNIYINKNSR